MISRETVVFFLSGSPSMLAAVRSMHFRCLRVQYGIAGTILKAVSAQPSRYAMAAASLFSATPLLQVNRQRIKRLDLRSIYPQRIDLQHRETGSQRQRRFAYGHDGGR